MSAKPAPPLDFTYNAVMYEQHDGDTVKVCIDVGLGNNRVDTDFGLGIFVEGRRVKFHTQTRFLGIDAPELKTDDGKLALAFASQWVKDNCKQVMHFDEVCYAVKVKTVRDGDREKYGRLLITLYGTKAGKTKKSLNDIMVEMGHAVAYWGGAKS